MRSSRPNSPSRSDEKNTLIRIGVFFFVLSHLAGLNRGPTRYECVALPTELRWPTMEKNRGKKRNWQPLLTRRKYMVYWDRYGRSARENRGSSTKTPASAGLSLTGIPRSGNMRVSKPRANVLICGMTGIVPPRHSAISRPSSGNARRSIGSDPSSTTWLSSPPCRISGRVTWTSSPAP